jgi:hypothetical protein
MDGKSMEADNNMNKVPRPDWLSAPWKRRKRITISKENLQGQLQDFPLLVSLQNDADIARHANADGSDIVFTADDGITCLSHSQVVHQRLLREQAVWTIWSDPRAVRYVGHHDRTYIAYYTTNQGWWVSAFDHKQKSWKHFQLRSHEQSADGRWWDDHNNPAITVRKDGRIVAVYGEHSTERSWTRITREPEDITSWQNEIPFTQEQEIAGRTNRPVMHFFRRVWAKLTKTNRPKLYEPSYSYVNLHTLPDGTIWRQYRPLRTWSGLSRNPTFVTSRDGGQSWSDPVRFIHEEKRSPYLVTARDGNRIHFFFSDAHPDEWDKSSIYHAYYDHAQGTYHKSDGTLIGDASCLPFTPAQATKVFDGTTAAGEAWAYNIAIGENGQIAGLFNVYSGKLSGAPSYHVHEYWYAHWDGKRWTAHKIAAESDTFCTGQHRYSGGFVVDTMNISVVYISLVSAGDSESARTRHIWCFETSNNGRTWQKRKVSRGDQGKAHSRPVVPLNRHPDLPVFWLYGHYVNYLEYWTALAAGDHGTLLDSEHYVKIPRINPEQDLTLYVYYNNETLSADRALSDKVWPASCSMSYRGTLTHNKLGPIPPRQADGDFVLEIVAVWASDRKATGEAAIIASDPKSDVRLWIGKTNDNSLELRFSTPTIERTCTFSDLHLRARNWKQADAPLVRSVIQLVFFKDGSVRARLNGVESHLTGEMREFVLTPREDIGPLHVAPHPERGMRFQGWVETVRFFDTNPGDPWLDMSAVAEHEGAALLSIAEEK